VAFPPATPFTLQVTEVFVLPATAALYCDDAPSVTLLEPLRVTVIVDGGVTAAAARATGRLWEMEGLATLVAVIVTFED
jgi:hypothetical protein